MNMHLYAGRLYLSILLYLILCSPAFAAPTILEEINVRAERQTSTQESLTIREVRETPARDLGEALLAIPGFDSVNKGAIANDVVLRGLQGDDINVFLDGVRLYGGCPSRMDPPAFHFDFAEVEQIEVVKGPYDLENPGSLGGMVNAVSKTPPLGLAANLNVTLGSFELRNLSETASARSASGDILAGYAYKSSLSPRSGDGKRQIEVIPAPAAMTPDRRYRPNELDSKAYEMNTAWLKGGYNLQTNVRTELGYSYQNADHVLYPYLLMDADYDRTHRVNWELNAERLDGPLSAVDVQLYWNQVEHLMHDEYRNSSLPSMMVTKEYSMQTDSKTSVYGGKLKGDWPIAKGTLSTGLDYYARNWDAQNEAAMYLNYTSQAMLPDVDSHNIGAFAAYVRPLPHGMEIKGGLRLDYNESQANALPQSRLVNLYQTAISGANLNSKNDFTAASGNVQLSWQVNEMLELFSGLGLGSRMPDPQELYIGLDRGAKISWVGNPNLQETQNRQIDLGAKLAGENYFIHATGFYSSLLDYINLVQSTKLSDGAKVKTYQNVEASLWGVEVNSQLVLPFDLYLQGKLAYVRGENEDKSQPLSEISPLNGSAGVRWDNETYYAEVTERFAAAQERVDPDLDEDSTAGWAVTDLKAGANWAQWGLAAGLNNLFDLSYVSHLSYQRDPFSSGIKVPEVGRFLYATLSYRF